MAPPRRRTGRRDCRSLACGRRRRERPSAAATAPSRTSRRCRVRCSATRLDGVRGPPKRPCAREDIRPRPRAAFELGASRWPRMHSVDGTPYGVLRARRGAGLSDHRHFWHSAPGPGRPRRGSRGTLFFHRLTAARKCCVFFSLSHAARGAATRNFLWSRARLSGRARVRAALECCGAPGEEHGRLKHPAGLPSERVPHAKPPWQ